MTPDGYFEASSANGAGFVNYRKVGSNKIHSLSKEFERKGLLGHVWKGEDYRN